MSDPIAIVAEPSPSVAIGPVSPNLTVTAAPPATLTVTAASAPTLAISVPDPIGLVDVVAPGSGSGLDFAYVAADWEPSGASVLGAQRLRLDGTLFVCAVAGTPGTWWSLPGWTEFVQAAIGYQDLYIDTYYD